ncbi:MAG: HEAT repeat domain-containing protein [Chloracidobacterium sp.]|nr:HEAT repeat domain-containing protein [Chloracidobacterium sp.]
MTSQLKRTVRSAAFCCALLAAGLFVLVSVSSQPENAIDALLRLPAPPPPNPDAVFYGRTRPAEFYDKNKPPADNAPIADLMEYWRAISGEATRLRYSPTPSERTTARLIAEIQKDPRKLIEYLGIMPDDERTGDLVKDLYDRNSGEDGYDKNEQQQIKRWLTYHTPHFSHDLARVAQRAGADGENVRGEEELLALTRVDYLKAEPIVDRLYLDSSNPVAQVLGTWARYRHALDEGSTGDIERYRDELQKFVEKRDASNRTRDLALDALVLEKDWGSRDEWYYTLLADPTLADLGGFTGLTTIILNSPDDKYIDKMLELVKSDDPHVRAAAVRNLVLKVDSGRPEVIEALLPWLEDPNWAKDPGTVRISILRALKNIKLAESVPGLIKALDERGKRPDYMSNVAMANTNVASNRWVNSNRSASPNVPADYLHLRYDAIAALGTQADQRAVPALRRILNEGESPAQLVIEALVKSKGFTVAEQVEGLDLAVRGQSEAQAKAEAMAAAANAAGAAANDASSYWDHEYTLYGSNSVFNRKYDRPPTQLEIKKMVGVHLLESTEVSDELAAGVVDHIEMLDKREPKVARAFRDVVQRWQNSAIDLLLLRDVKHGIANADSIVRLLAVRKKLQAEQSAAVHDLRTGTPTAVGIAACLLEDNPDYSVILDEAPVETKTAMLACARLIRAELPLDKVAEATRSADRRLFTAAELYAESEDSQAARTIVLSRHLGEAKITGATTAFFVTEEFPGDSGMLWQLFQSIGDSSAGYNGWIYDSAEHLRVIEKRLQDEVKKDDKLLGVYAYERNYVRIYKDKVIFSWDEDDSRFRERALSKEEFDELRAYLTVNNVDEMRPYLQCGGEYCEARELLMLGRNGGRRVFMNGSPPPFFAGLDKYFAALKKTPASIRYALGRDIPGLEVLLADDYLHVETVWKDGADLRVAASDMTVRKRVSDEIERAIQAEAPDDGIETEADYTSYQQKQETGAKLAKKREFEGVGWHQVVDGRDAGPAAQPAGVDYVPVADSFPVKATQESWKARAGGIELRGHSDGLYKIQAGRMSKIAAGEFYWPVITPNARWAIVNRGGDEEGGGRLVRVNLLNNRITPVPLLESYLEFGAASYIPATGGILVDSYDSYDYEYAGLEIDDEVSRDSAPTAMRVISPETGEVKPVIGEMRPLAQQTYRPLQETAKPNEFWAALPNHKKNLTEVGVYNSATLSFRLVMTVPKIKFNSMTMWVDEAGSKVYFVYRGHLLAVPLPK